MSQEFSTSLQEDVLALLCFDDRWCQFAAAGVRAELFESSVYQDIVRRATTYIEKYQEAPKAHLDTILSDLLEDEKRGKLFVRVVKDLYQHAENINAEYVVSSLREFVRTQSLKTGVVEAVELIKTNRIDEAEVALANAMKQRYEVFDAGAKFWLPSDRFAYDDQEFDVFKTGLPALDHHHLGPARKTLWMLIGRAKIGKSWSLVHLGKMALLQGYSVLYVTLEMPQWQVTRRFIQSMFSISKATANKVHTTRVITNKTRTHIRSLEPLLIDVKHSMEDGNIADVINKKVRKMGRKLPLIVKEFPTGMLTMSGFKAYLEALYRHEHFFPDLVLFDYPDLMNVGVSIESDQGRKALGNVFKELRGLAMQNNFAMATVTQSNRGGAQKERTEDTDVAEDWSKIATADTILTYNATPKERERGLGRLWVSNARDNRDKFEIVLSQCYDIGQFALSSGIKDDGYTRMFKKYIGKDGDDEEQEQ